MEHSADLSSIFWQFCKFAFVGALATSIHYVILTFLVELLQAPLVFSTTVGFAIAAIVNYVCNRRYTFESNTRHTVALPKFLIVALLGAALNAGVVSWLDMHVQIHYLVAQACATITVLLWNFTANAIWTFKSRVMRNSKS
jgi:putative flippase GtrA